MKRMYLIFLITSLLFSCAAQGKSGKNPGEPEWLQNPKKVYSDQLYLTAIGEGDTRSEAENFAASNLAKIFESQISADDTYKQRYIELTKDDETTFEDLTDVTKDVKVTSAQTLYNIQFSESYTNKVGRVHVLAYLNRTQTAEIYEEKINKNSRNIEYYVAQAESSDDVRVKYAALSAAALISNNNEILLKQLDIISPNFAEFIEINYDHNEISRLAAEYARSISFKIDIKNDRNNKITNIVKNMFTDMGFVMNSNPVLSVKGDIRFEETDLNRDDFEFIRYELNLEITDLKNTVVSSLTEKGKEGHTTYFEAEERAVRKLSEKIGRSFKNKLIDYFDGLIKKK
jgi:hypothetical protein